MGSHSQTLVCVVGLIVAYCANRVSGDRDNDLRQLCVMRITGSLYLMESGFFISPPSSFMLFVIAHTGFGRISKNYFITMIMVTC